MSKNPNPTLVIETSLGTMKAELWADKAPKTAANFLDYVDKKFYDGLIFHRVIDAFMVQGGGFDAKMVQKPTAACVKNEAAASLRNDRGTLAMARTSDIHSASSQFFINLVDNDFLNHKDETSRGFGYCAFGKLTEGLDVLDKIAKVPTTRVGQFDDVPRTAVEINSVRRG